MEDYKKYIYRQKEMRIEQVKGEDFEEAIRGLKETAGGLDQWDPADLRLLSKEACKELANFFNMIAGEASWPKQLNLARAAFLAKEVDSDMDPLAYRVLLMLPSVYRLWGKDKTCATPALDCKVGVAADICWDRRARSQ